MRRWKKHVKEARKKDRQNARKVELLTYADKEKNHKKQEET